MADGSIEFSVELDAKNAEKELQRLKVSIVKLEAELRAQTARKTALEAEMEAAGVAADNANAKLQELLRRREQMNNPSAGGDLTYEDFGAGRKALDAEIKEQQAIVKGLEKDFNDAASAVDKMNAKIDETTAKIGASQEIAGELTKQLAEMPEPMETSSRLTAELDKRFSKLTTRISGLFKRVFFFSLITAGLRDVREALGNVIAQNSEVSDALARLKGALLTLAAPVIDNVLLPALAATANALARIVTVAAQLVALLFGQTLSQSQQQAEALWNEAQAISATGKAAKESGKFLAAFDEINQISDTGGGGGSSAAAAQMPTFDAQGVGEVTLQKILALATMIGTTIAGWRIGKGLGLDIDQTIGLIAALAGTVLFVWGLFDAWTNGVDFGNLTAMVIGLTAAAIGLGVALGPVAAGIALIVGGLAMLVVGIRDAMKNGMNWANTLTMIAGLLAAGIGIGILTGSWIPLLIAGIASVLLALTMAFGDTEKFMNGVKLAFQGVLDFVSGVFTGDWSKAWKGVKEIFFGVWTSLVAVVEAVINAIIKGINALTTKLNGALRITVPDWIPLIGGKRWSPNIKQIPTISIPVKIPALAAGAVIPPNSSFLAMLGDQTSGRNIEAPEGLISQIVAREMEPLAGLLRELIEVEREGRVIAVDGYAFGRAGQRAQQNVGRMGL